MGAGAPTLALRPFRHLSRSRAPFFTEGLTQNLAAALAHFDEFVLITTDGVVLPTYRLDRTIQMAGDHVRVTIQLGEAASGVRAETFDRHL